MSDGDLSDGMEELQELIAEYKAKAEKEQNESKDKEQNEGKAIKRESKGKRTTDKSMMNTEVPMDKVLFGHKDEFLKNLAKAVGENSSERIKKEEDDDVENNASDDNTKSKAIKRKPVWTDVDDEEILLGEVKRATKRTGPLGHLPRDKSYKEYVQKRFERIMPQPKWASLDRQKPKHESEDENLLRTVGFIAKSQHTNLPPQNIYMKHLRDLNRETYAEGSINSIQFHPTSTAALVAGQSGIATIYSVDGVQNEKLHNMHFKKFPIKCAKITPCGTKAIFGSQKPYYYVYDLMSAQENCLRLPSNLHLTYLFNLSPCGRYIAFSGINGMLHLMELASNEHIHTFKQESAVASIRFTADSKRLICSSKSCMVNIFSVRQQRLEHSFIDDGCIRGRALDISPNQRLLATGSNEGVVNVYDFDKVLSTKSPLPEKNFMNLTTAIADVKFNHTSEVLAMCSNEVAHGVKLAHIQSGTVYRNFPVSNMKLGKIRTMEFSPNSGYFAMGNLKEVPLFRIKHFKNY